MFRYNFPKNARAGENTLSQQIEKCVEELNEVCDAWDQLDEYAVIEETIDLIYAAEGILRKFNKQQVDAMREVVYQKAQQRKDIP